MSATIYLVTNTINGKQYVGYTIDLEKRLSSHKSADTDTHFYRAIRKYGWENFDVDVIFEHDDEKWTLAVMEPHFIAWYDTYHNGYNLTEGGEGALGRCVSEDTRSRIGDALRGKRKSDAHRKKLSDSLKGKPSVNRGKKKPPRTEEHKRKIAEANRGKKRSAESRRKMSEAAKRREAAKRLSSRLPG